MHAVSGGRVVHVPGLEPQRYWLFRGCERHRGGDCPRSEDFAVTVYSVKVLAELNNGYAVVEDDSGRAFLRDRNDKLRPVEPEETMGLVPILEAPRESIPEEVLARLPIAAILVCALTWSPGSRWTSLAVGWLTADDLKDRRIHAAVGEIASSSEQPQPLQHAARRLLKTANLPRHPH